MSPSYLYLCIITYAMNDITIQVNSIFADINLPTYIPANAKKQFRCRDD